MHVWQFLIRFTDLYQEYPMQEKERLGGDVDFFDATSRILVKEPYRLLQVLQKRMYVHLEHF